MKTISMGIALVLLTTRTLFSMPDDRVHDFESVRELVKQGLGAYVIKVACIPVPVSGAQLASNVYDNSLVDFSVSGVLWVNPVNELMDALSRHPLVAADEVWGWNYGIKIIEKSTGKVILSVEWSTIALRVISVNGKNYKAPPEAIEWLRRQVLPPLKFLNKGYLIKDL